MMSKKLQKELKKISISAVFFAVGMLLEHLPAMLGMPVHDGMFEGSFGAAEILGLTAVASFIISYILVGLEVVKSAISGIRHKQMMDESFLMTVATFGAFLLGDLGEACAVMLFFQVGEWFQKYAVGKSRKSIADLMNICPEYANVKRNDEWMEVEPESVQVGEYIVIKPGERVPLDGIVRAGMSSLDTKAISGESMPRDVKPGDAIVSGTINISATLEVEVTKAYENSTVAKILELVENASSNKAEAEQFISRFARVYTPIVVYSALALALLPPFFITAGNLIGLFTIPVKAGWSDWIYRGLVFLVTSCPCALVISIPLSFFGGIGGAGKEGILIKGSNYLEAFAKVKTVVMDKTGTLTKGTFTLQELHPIDITKEKLLELLAHVEYFSNHPIAKSITAAYHGQIEEKRIHNMQELPGKGIRAVIDGCTYYGGNERLMEALGIKGLQANITGTVVHLAKEDRYLGYAVVADSLKEDALVAVNGMKEQGISRLIMLSGDNRQTAEKVAADLGLDQAYGELLPVDKVTRIEEIMSAASGVGKTCFVGDGMNDAPVLARADIGIAMGGMGSDAAIEAADIVIMTDEPYKIVRALKISKKTLAIVRQNIVGAIGIKIIVLLLTAIGMVGMWAAVFADVGVAFLAILNAMRALKTR